MISALGRPLIDYVLEALRGCREVSEVIVSVTGSTPLTEAHVRSRGYQSILCPGSVRENDLRYALQILSTPFALTVPANLPLLRPESIDDVVDEFYRSRKSSMVVGVPIDDVQEVISDPAAVKDMNGIRVIPCGVKVFDRDILMSGRSPLGRRKSRSRGAIGGPSSGVRWLCFGTRSDERILSVAADMSNAWPETLLS